MTTPPYLNEEEVAAFRAMRNCGLFFRLNLPVTSDGDQTLRLWGGIGDYPVKPGTSDTPFTGFESVDQASDVYHGAGKLLNIPELEALVNGQFDRVQFALSGVSAEILSRIDESAPPVKGQELRVGIAPLDERWQPVIPIKALWLGIADFWAAKMEPARNAQQAAVRTIILSVASGTTGRTRPRRVSYTHKEQQIRYPGDRFFERVTRYVNTYVCKWPGF